MYWIKLFNVFIGVSPKTLTRSGWSEDRLKFETISSTEKLLKVGPCHIFRVTVNAELCKGYLNHKLDGWTLRELTTVVQPLSASPVFSSACLNDTRFYVAELMNS